MSAGTGTYPARDATTTYADHEALLATLGTWLNDRGDQLVGLDERATINGTDAQRNDVTLAFVLWQAAVERRDELVAVRWPDHKRPSADVSALVYRPIVDRAGLPLAADLPEAVAIVDELASRLRTALDRHETTSAAQLAAWSAAEADLAEAERLAESLGDQVRAAADLRREMDRLRGSSVAPGAETEFDDQTFVELAAAAERLRADLESTDAERRDVLAACARAHGELTRLRGLEADARTAVAACAELVTDPPRLAVPSVDAVAAPPPDLAERPWPQARPIAQAFVDVVDRLDRALNQVIAANTAPRRERDDLRGLLHAYRDMAAAAGAAERPEIDGAYRLARDVLWSAPCDLATARSHVAAYQSAVRSATDGSAAPTIITEETP